MGQTSKLISKEVAQKLACEQILQVCNSSQVDLVLVPDATVERVECFVFFYTSKKYLETGDVRHAIAGNAPVLVDRITGCVSHTGTALPTQEYIDLFEIDRKRYYAERAI